MVYHPAPLPGPKPGSGGSWPFLEAGGVLEIDHFFLLGALVTTNAEEKKSHAHVPNSITFHSHLFF